MENNIDNLYGRQQIRKYPILTSTVNIYSASLSRLPKMTPKLGTAQPLLFSFIIIYIKTSTKFVHRNGSKWAKRDLTGPSGAKVDKRVQQGQRGGKKGLTGFKRYRKGSRGVKRGQKELKGPTGAKWGQTGPYGPTWFK